MRKPEGLSGAAWETFASTLLAQIHTLSESGSSITSVPPAKELLLRHYYRG